MISVRPWAYTLVACACALALADVALGTLASIWPRGAYLLADPAVRNLVPDRTRGYRMSPYLPGNDFRGYRNDEPRAAYDVLAIGDSMTYGFGVVGADAWPQQLERLSGRTVYNAGVGGYGPCEYLETLRELLPIAPKLVVLGLYVGNDVGNAYGSLYLQNRCSQLETPNIVTRSAMRAAEREQDLHELAADLGEEQRASAPRPNLLMRSSLYRLSTSLTRQLQRGPALWNRGERPNTFEQSARGRLRVVMDGPAPFRTVFRDPRLDTLAINIDDPRMEEGLEATFRAVERMQALASDARATLVVAIIDSKPFALAPILRTRRKDLWPSFESLVGLEQTVAGRLTSGLTQRGIRVVDTGTPMRELVESGTMPFHESDDSHPNAAGYLGIARTIWDYVQSIHPPPTTVSPS